jgi:hypothetical protein
MVKRSVAKQNGKSTFYWAIEGYDSTKKIFSTKFRTTLMSDRQIEPLLKALTARARLTLEEIIGCYIMKNTKLYGRHLKVHRDLDIERRRTNLLSPASLKSDFLATDPIAFF